MTHRLSQMLSHFSTTPLEAPDAIFGLVARFKGDPSENKVDLVVGAYRDDNGKPWVLPVVRKAEELLLGDHVDHEYLPLDGLKEFTEASSALFLGQGSPALTERRFLASQALSGTGALRLAAEFLSKHYPHSKVVYIPNQTWPNHQNVFGDAGLSHKAYRYYNKDSISLDFEGLIQDLKDAPDRSIILFHTCAHNPTGIDPSKDQWKEIANVVLSKEHLPLFDTAYQGFATGDLEGDVFSARLFISMGIEIIATQSFAKNMGLYGERVGNLLFVTKSADSVPNIKSQLQRITRGMISNCPSYGARVAAKILNDPTLYKEWEENVKTMANRIIAMRKALYDELIRLQTPGKWDHILSQIGMFTFTGLNADQCERMMTVHHVYLTKNGRISMAGLNTKNVLSVAKAINEVVTHKD